MTQEWQYGSPAAGKYLVACSECGRERWLGKTQITRAKYKGLCSACSRHRLRGEAHPFWKGGRQEDGRYIKLRLWPEDFYYPMASKSGYAQEHRVIMAKSLGRCLHRWEVVHHKDGDGKNNDLSNLELSTNGAHVRDHSLGYRHGYRHGLYDGHHEKALREVIEWLDERIERPYVFRSEFEDGWRECQVDIVANLRDQYITEPSKSAMIAATPSTASMNQSPPLNSLAYSILKLVLIVARPKADRIDSRREGRNDQEPIHRYN